MRRGLLVLVPMLLIGVVAGVSAISAHQGDAAFVFYQEHPRTVQPRQLELLLEKTREPVPEGPGAPATRARCTPGKNGPKRNPWRCTVRYRSGHAIRYTIEVERNGSFKGADRTGAFTVSGCCLAGGSSLSS